MEHQQDEEPRSIAELLQNIASRGPAATEEQMAEHRAALARDVEMSAVNHRRDIYIARSRIPAKYLDARWSTYSASTAAQRKVAKIGSAYAERFGHFERPGASLLLMGAIGTGKTLLASLIAKQVMERVPALYMTVTDMHRWVRASYAKGSLLTEADVMEQLATMPLLIIDEIGASRGSDAEKQLMFDVIDSRYANQKPMILATNLDPDELREELGERMMDRLREVCTVLVFDWESLRGVA